MKTKVLSNGPLIRAFILFCPLLFGFPSRADEMGGGLTGLLRYQGTPLRIESVSTTKDPEICGSVFTEKTPVNGINKGVRDVVISLRNKAGRSAKPGQYHQKTAAKILVKGCHFNPGVFATDIRYGLSIENQDPILHVFQFQRENQSLFSLPVKPKGTLAKSLDQEGIIRVACVLHNFMKISIAVVDTPFFTLSDQDGRFSIPEISPGKYRLTIWHPLFKPVERDIEISTGQTVNFSADLESVPR